jgi:predicted nucleic acid-binding protein
VRIFLDANVIFSAVKSDGYIRRLLLLLAEQDHELVADDYALEETKRNLSAKYPSALAENSAILSLVSVFHVRQGVVLPKELALTEKDRPVLASAIALRSDALVTGDKGHFNHLYGECVEGVEIYSPNSIAQRLFQSPSPG